MQFQQIALMFDVRLLYESFAFYTSHIAEEAPVAYLDEILFLWGLFKGFVFMLAFFINIDIKILVTIKKLCVTI